MTARVHHAEEKKIGLRDWNLQSWMGPQLFFARSHVRIIEQDNLSLKGSLGFPLLFITVLVGECA